jgi:hypothetical protein
MLKRAWRFLKGWRTIVLSVLYAAWSAAVALDWQSLVDDKHTLGAISFGIAFVTILLRLDTTGPVGRKPNE